MPHIIDLDNPNIAAPLAEAAQLTLERQADIDLDSFILGFEMMLNASREDRNRRSHPST